MKDNTEKMGEIADMMVNGMLCCDCGAAVGDEVGYPRYCNDCKPENEALAKEARKAENIARNERQKKIKCPVCSKRVKEVGLPDHMRDAHSGTIEDMSDG